MKKIILLSLLAALISVIPLTATAKTAKKLTLEEIADANDFVNNELQDDPNHVKAIWLQGKKIKWTAKELRDHEKFQRKVEKNEIKRKKRVNGKLVDVICDMAYIQNIMRLDRHFDPNDIQDILNRERCPLDGHLYKIVSDPNE